MQIALFWALAAHVTYLRTRGSRHLVAALRWVVVGLLFYEKTLLVLGAFGIVTLAYFATGDAARTGCGTRVARYRGAASSSTSLLGARRTSSPTPLSALNFSPGSAGNDALGEVVTEHGRSHAYLPALVGGPLQLATAIDQFVPPRARRRSIVLASVVAGRAGAPRDPPRPRPRSLRAWLLPAFFLVCDIVLVVAGRGVLRRRR